MELARFLERSINTSMLLDVHLREFHDSLRTGVEATDYVEWLSLLRCCASFDAYVRAHSASIRPLHVVDFLVLDAQFPRSLRFSADRIEESLKRLSRLSGPDSAGARRAARRPAARLAAVRADRGTAARRPAADT